MRLSLQAAKAQRTPSLRLGKATRRIRRAGEPPRYSHSTLQAQRTPVPSPFRDVIEETLRTSLAELAAEENWARANPNRCRLSATAGMATVPEKVRQPGDPQILPAA
jgi:hypothetical protein